MGKTFEATLIPKDDIGYLLIPGDSRVGITGERLVKVTIDDDIRPSEISTESEDILCMEKGDDVRFIRCSIDMLYDNHKKWSDDGWKCGFGNVEFYNSYKDYQMATGDEFEESVDNSLKTISEMDDRHFNQKLNSIKSSNVNTIKPDNTPIKPEDVGLGDDEVVDARTPAKTNDGLGKNNTNANKIFNYKSV